MFSTLVSGRGPEDNDTLSVKVFGSPRGLLPTAIAPGSLCLLGTVVPPVLLLNEFVDSPLRVGFDDEAVRAQVSQDLPDPFLRSPLVFPRVTVVAQSLDGTLRIPGAAEGANRLGKDMPIGMILLTMAGDADRGTAVVAVGALLPRAVRIGDGGVADGMVRAEAVGVEQLSDGPVVLEGHERCFGDLVVAGGEELAQADVLPAAAPALAGRDKARLLTAWHEPKVAILGLKSRHRYKDVIQGLV